jgi:hypothetical protein
VVWDSPSAIKSLDKIYVSCVFEKNRGKCEKWISPKTVIGGSGYDVSSVLPPEIECVKPHINLGFTTRGCIRRCSFCIVPKKEGRIRVVGDLLDIWDGKSKEVRLLDNNILALPDHFRLICSQARENRIRIDFNQGLDHRLLTQEIVDELKTISHFELRFAFDHPSSRSSVEKALALLKKNRINRCYWYVLVAYNTTFQEDLDRLNFLRDNGQNVFLQRYNWNLKTGDRKYIPLAKWANHHFFQKYTFTEFMQKYYPTMRQC